MEEEVKSKYFIVFVIALITGVLLFDPALSPTVFPKTLENFLHHTWMQETFGKLEVNQHFQEEQGEKHGPLYRYFFVPAEDNKYRGEVAFSVFTDSIQNVKMISIWSLWAQDWRDLFLHEDTRMRAKQYLMFAFVREVAGLTPRYLRGKTYDTMLDRINEEIHVPRSEREKIQGVDSPHNIIVWPGSVKTAWNQDESSFIIHAFTETKEDIILQNSQSYIDIYYWD